MAIGSNIAEEIQKVLIEEANFDASLLERDYRFAQHKSIALAGFAYRPLDARSACIGVDTAAAGETNISQYRDLGAPLLLLQSNNAFDLWRVGSHPERDARIKRGLSIDGIGRYFSSHANSLRPRRIYEAKTVARIERAPEQLQLFANFVDPGLLPIVESQLGQRLTETVVESIRELVGIFGEEEWVITAVFRLLAGKILRDKNVPGFKSLVLSHVDHVLQKVERHYGSRDLLKITKKNAASLQHVMSRIQQVGDLRNLTTESLGDVYEQALITADIRKIHGTHKTPSYLVDYIVWQLAKWIEEIPVQDLRFFEPGCGHAPFLVSLMRMMRTLDIDEGNLSRFFRERFLGIDNDPFALEIARLSLTLADEPNPDGWDGLIEADMYAGDLLEKTASRSTVMLTNPPYKGRKAEELLYRTLPHLPVGAIFGVIVPATLLFSDKPRAIKLRSWITAHCQLAEVDLLPDGLFTFADQECAVLIGRKLDTNTPTDSLQSRLQRVRDKDVARESFKLDYVFSSTRMTSQAKLARTYGNQLWVAEFQEEIWTYLRNNDLLASIADIGKGFEHVGRSKLNGQTVVSDLEFPDSELGYSIASGNWQVHEGPKQQYLSTSEAHVGVARRGLDRVPQVLLNYAPVGRGFWKLKPFIDTSGRPFMTRFLCVRPIHPEVSLQYLWAILASPVAALYVWSHILKRDILPARLGRLPVPVASEGDISRISALVDYFFEVMKRGPKTMLTFGEDGYSEPEVRNSLCAIDAEVLRLYALPAKSERLLLEQFRGEQRPGIPIEFTEYYPSDTSVVPLYAYLSNSYQRWLKGGSAELSDEELSRYEALVTKSETGRLTKREEDRLHQLQAEVDGRDYAMQRPTQLSDDKFFASPELDRRLRALSDRAVSASLRRERQ